MGVGSGEALNEHIFGDAWPNADERLEMLEESIEVIRTLWQGGAQNHRGRHYRVEHARIYDLPDEPTPILISGFGPKAIELAGRIGDGFCTVEPDAEAVRSFAPRAARASSSRAGRRSASAEMSRRHSPTSRDCGPTKGCRASCPDSAHAGALRAGHGAGHPEMLAEAVVCGPDIDRHVAALQEYADAGFDELYVNQIGPDQDAFFAAYSQDVLPRLR